jgi:outer membrane immunogenic protein
MKKKTAIGFALAMVSSAASAADIPPFSAAPAPYASYNWLGPYAGINLGYQWGSVTNSGGASPSGFAGGVQGGYNWQMGQFVYGVEADLQVSGASDTFAAYQFSNPWFGTLRGRAGYALNNILFYGTLGLAYGQSRIEFFGLSEGHLHPGWAGGGGMEIALTPNWTARAEYLFIDLSDEAYGLTGVKNGFESSLLRFGANYKF